MEFPKLPAEIESVNKLLIDYFGSDTITGKAMWRVSWSNDQYEMRRMEYTDSGLQLLTPEVREMPKYPWIKGRWILEHLELIANESDQKELPSSRQSYECKWNFDRLLDGIPLKPSFEACKFVVDAYNAATGKKSLRKYIDNEETPEVKNARIAKIEEELFGDESGLLGRTITGEAVAMPQNYGNGRES